MIKITGLNKFFNKGKSNQIHVINDISLDMPDSGMVAIFGRSGCGKTTLLNVIGGLDGYESGTLFIDGNDVGRDTDVIRNKYIGYIFQNYNLNKAESCYDNVADALRLCGMPDGDRMRERVMAALKNVGMENYHGRTPDTLSGGQQQRIAIARAIVKNPKIILADEPTGNLDEANTVMIMDLLKQISKDHLVLLVTHEANLVDYYCDTVIELMDGKVVNVRNNSRADGYVTRSKNDVYLGELQKTEISNENACVELYGDAPVTPIRLKIVNTDGKIYVQIDTPTAQVIDESSEVKLIEGVYVQAEEEIKRSDNIDMSKLPPIKGERFGKLFTLKSSVKSGYNVNFKKGKRGKKALKGCMCLFAAVIVFMSAFFGTSFADLIDVDRSYNHNVFYVYTPDAATSDKLLASVSDASVGVDYARLFYGVPYGDASVRFMTGYFESFSSASLDESYKTNAVLLDVTLIGELQTVAGVKDGIRDNEIVITTRVADALLENSSLGYIREYDDLIGLITPSASVDGSNLRIAGIVESDESSIYLSELGMAKHVMAGSDADVALGTEIGLELGRGEAVFATRYKDSTTTELPKAGDTVKIHGKDVRIANVIKYYPSFNEWLEGHGISTKNGNGVTHGEIEARLKRDYPDLVENTNEYHEKYAYVSRVLEFERYEQTVSYFDEYAKERYMFDSASDINIWLYLEKGLDEVRYMELPIDFYVATKFKEANGRYPTERELSKLMENTNGVHETVDNYVQMYQDEYSLALRTNISNVYYLNEADYIEMSKRVGETHASAMLGANGGLGGEIMYEKMDMEMSYIGGSTSSVAVGGYGRGGLCYTVLHSSDPSATEEWLEREFGGMTTGLDHAPALLTPNDLYQKNVSSSSESITRGILTVVATLALMSLCMYFIMRSALLNRIKEIGIYRAIGVSKKNLVFRFIIESLLLTTLTVLIGYAVTSAFLGVMLGISPMIKNMLYYPVWLAGAVLVALYAICTFFGTLPILSLLRKTPSEILAKYDI